MGFIYVYEDRDFKPSSVNMFGYTIGREDPTEVDTEVAAKLRKHPHFVEVGVAASDAVARVSDTKAEDKATIDSSGLLEASGIMTPEEIKKAKKASYMREYFAKKRASK